MVVKFTSYRATVLHGCVVFAFFAAPVTNVLTEIFSNGWVWTLSDGRFLERVPTPGTYMGYAFILHNYSLPPQG